MPPPTARPNATAPAPAPPPAWERGVARDVLGREAAEGKGGQRSDRSTERGTALVFAVVRWGDRVLQADAVRPGRPLALGERPGDLYVPSAVLGADHMPLITFVRSEPIVHLPRFATGTIRRSDGSRRSIEPLRPAAGLRHMAPALTPWALPVGASVELAMEPLTIVVSRCIVDRAVLRRRARPFDRRVVASCAAAAIPMLGLLATAANALPSLGDAAAEELASSTTPYVLTLGWDAASEQERAPTFSPDSELRERPCPAEPGVPCRCRPNGELMGERFAERHGRYGVVGPLDNPDPHIARSRLGRDDGALPSPVGPFLAPPWADPDAPVAPWGRDDSLGTDPLSARGAMWADVTEVAPGSHDLGIEWPAAGLSKAIEPSDEPTAPASPGSEPPRDTPAARRADAEGPVADAPPVRPRVVHANLSVHGPIARSALLATLADRLPAALDCYRAALEGEPDLSVRITIALTVPSDPASPVGVTLQTGRPTPRALAACLERAYAGLDVPRPPQAVGIVRYPLYLLPAKP